MSNPRVLIINFHGIEFPGGVQSVVNTLVKDSNLEYRALSGGNEEFEKIIINDIIEYKSLCISEKCSKKELEQTLQKIWENYLPEIIYSHNLTYMFESKKAETIFNFFKNKDCTMIEHVHHAFIRRKQRCKKALNFDWDKIIVVSKYAYNRILPIIKNKKTKRIVQIVPNAINLDYFSPKKILEAKKKRLSKKFCFIFPSRTVRISTGEIGEQKQFLTVIKALNKLKIIYKKDFSLIIPHLGVSGGQTSKGEKLLKEKLREHNILKETIIYPKKLLQKDMIEFYAQGDIVLFPSLGESFGLVTIETQACGIPVIVANSGASPELVKNNYTGLIVKPKSINQLVEAMNKLIVNSELRKKLSINGLRNSKKYSSKIFSKQITSIFDSNSKKKTIILVRHGQTALNKKGAYSGQMNTSLTPKGIAQAKKIKHFFDEKQIDSIYCSTLERARKTAQIIFGNKKIVYSELLKEIDVGEFSGKTREQLTQEYPKFKGKFDLIQVYPGGETINSLEKRVKKFLNKISISKKNRETIVIVSHELVTKTILGIITKNGVNTFIRHRNREVIIIHGKSFEKINF